MDASFKPHRVKVFMSGDSITEGDGNASAYRYALFEKLYSAGAVFSFVGANTSGDVRLPKAYHRHGGHCGYIIGSDAAEDNSIRGKLEKPEYRAAAAEADVVLLWIGFNDYGRKCELDKITERYEKLLDKFYEINPKVIIYAATLFNRSEDQTVLNNWLLSFDTKAYLARGRELHIVDMSRFSLDRAAGDFPEDDGHPTEAGNVKIAAMWYDAIIGRVLELNGTGDPDFVPAKAVTSLSGDLFPRTLRPGESATLHASALPEDAEVTTVLWSVDAPRTASVDCWGLVRALSPGKAVVSAKTLDGGFTLRAEITVAGEPIDYTAGLEKVFESDFTSEESWKGTEGVFSPKFNKLAFRWNRSAEGELTSAAELEVRGKTWLSFMTHTANDRTRDRGRFLSVCFAGLELRISGGAKYTSLYGDGVLLGDDESLPVVARDDVYALLLDGSTAYVLRNNEILFSCTVGRLPESSAVSVKWEKVPKTDLRDIVVMA